jgi:hypothetical protein
VSYFITAASAAGQNATAPLGAPNLTYTTVAATHESWPFHDDFEVDQGWTVHSAPGLTSGAWELAAPVPGAGGPSHDGDGSGQCALTGSGDGAEVQGGTTSLVSPPFALGDASYGEAYLHYWRWFSNGLGGLPEVDMLLVEVSGDGGATWALLEQVGSMATWTQRVWRLRDSIALGDDVRVRFTAGDTGPPTPIEAAIDGVRIQVHACPESSPDINGDGVVDANDLVAVIVSWGACPDLPAPCAADVDGDGAVGFTDLMAVMGSWS